MNIVLPPGGVLQQTPVNPIELLFRPLLKGPMMVKVASDANASAGLTTLNSGSGTVTPASSSSDRLPHPRTFGPRMSALRWRA